MYCEKCGTPLNENSRVCPQCGAPIQGEEQNITPTSTYAGPLGNPVPVLVWGIVGLCCAVTPYVNFLGIIFSIVGLKKSNAYNQFTNFADSNMARIGRRLSIAGIITGAIFTFLFVILFSVLIFSVNRY